MTSTTTRDEESAPLVLTATLDEGAQAFFDGLRRRHFPPARSFLAAHVTLFHALPGAHRVEVEELVRETARRGPIAVEVTGLRFLGRGVAYALRAPELSEMRGVLARRCAAWLTPQDRAGFSPHVTIQNKVSPTEARRLFDDLRASFAPWTLSAKGLALWMYRGGPWSAVAEIPFDPAADCAPPRGSAILRP